MKRLNAVATAALLATGLFSISACAWAHAVVRSSVPANGAVVATSPKEVAITFNEKIETLFSTATLKDGAGAAIATGKAKVDPANPAILRLAVPELKPGEYAVHWTAVGTDGHRRNGDIRFSVK